MAVVKMTTRAGIERFKAVYRNVDGRQKVAGTFATRKEAEAAYMEAKAKVLRGIDPSIRETTVYPAHIRGRETILAFAERWLPEHELSPHSRRNYESMLGAHIIPKFGATAIRELTTQEVATWLRQLEKSGKSWDVVIRVKSILSAMCQAAAEEGILPINPVRGIRLKRPAKKRRKALTHDQYDKLRIELGEHWHLIADIITDTGLRWEEAMALQKSDLDGDVLWIGAVLNELRLPPRFQYLPRTKTGKGRQVKIRPALAERIRACPDGYLIRMPGREHQGKCRDNCRDCSHVRGDWFRAFVWRPAVKAIGAPEIVPRDMRRSHATWLRANGAPLEVVQQRLGHTKLTTTQIYLAEVPDSEDIAISYTNW